MSRKQNTIRNFITSSFSEILIMILKFVTRTVFIQYLGREYLGINGLFTNILQMLSLTELGLANALNYQLYKPLAERDEKRIRVLMKFYRDAYRVIGLVIIALGTCLIPFLPYLIHDYDKLASLGINAILIYLLYLMQNASTYLFFAYKSALIKADQKEYKLTIASYGITVASYVSQMLILVLLKNFVLYTGILIVFNILQNLVYARIVDKLYPYILSADRDRLSTKEIKGLFKDCYALFIYKINQVVLNATDNIVLSAFIGLAIVGEYSNYMMIYNQIKIIMIRCFNAIKASLGNIHAVESVDKEYSFFRILNLFTAITYGTAAIGTIVAGDSFIRSWIGDDFVLGKVFCLLLGIEIYILGIRQFMSSYRTTMGLFRQGKYRPLVGIILNIAISVALVKPLGLYGVMLGTILSDCLTMVWFDPIVIFKYGFKNSISVKDYFSINGKYLVVILFSTMISESICRVLPNSGWGITIVKIMICVAVSAVVFTLSCYRSAEYKFLYNQTKIILKKI